MSLVRFEPKILLIKWLKNVGTLNRKATTVEILLFDILFLIFFCKITKHILLPRTSRGCEYFGYALLERQAMFLLF
jgi:hypothetical protein